MQLLEWFINYSCVVPFIQLTVCINIAWVIDWLNSFVYHAEKDVNNHWCQINPEKIFECLPGLKVEEWVLLNTCAQEIDPAEYSVDDGHIGNEFPIILLQNGVGAESVDEASGPWNWMDELQMERSSPSIVSVLSVDVLLLLSEHKPVEAHDNKVANNCQSV